MSLAVGPAASSAAVEAEPGTAAPARYEWLDQARGLVVLGLIISMITGAYEGSAFTGDPMLGPTFLNHGYQYYDGLPAVVTLIDIGQPAFMFILGFVGYLAFMRRRARSGALSAWGYAARRVLLLYSFGFFEEGVLNRFIGGSLNWRLALYEGTFAKLAMGALAAYVTASLIRGADRRALFATFMAALHALLYVFPFFDHYTWFGDVMDMPYFPFGALNLVVMAIAGTCFAQWFVMDPREPLVGVRRRILPVTAGAWVAYYCMEWLQPAEHHDVTTALALLTVAVAGFMLMAFFSMDRMGLRFPVLSALGKNLLLMFALGWFVVNAYLALLPKEFLARSPILAMLLGGLAPIVALSLLAVFLNRKNIIIRA